MSLITRYMRRHGVHTMMPTIPVGDFYSCHSDDDELTHTEADEAIESYLEGLVETGGETIAETIARECPSGLTIYVFKRNEIGAVHINSVVEGILQDVEEQWGQEFGGPNDSIFDRVDWTTTVRPKLVEAITEMARKADVWACTQSATVDLTADQVAALLEGTPG